MYQQFRRCVVKVGFHPTKFFSQTPTHKKKKKKQRKKSMQNYEKICTEPGNGIPLFLVVYLFPFRSLLTYHRVKGGSSRGGGEGGFLFHGNGGQIELVLGQFAMVSFPVFGGDFAKKVFVFFGQIFPCLRYAFAQIGKRDFAVRFAVSALDRAIAIPMHPQ